MAKPRKKSPSHTDDQAIDDLAGLVAESLRSDFHSDLEPFEVYASRVKGRIIADINLFRKRFHHGYQVLMEELTREKTEK